MRYNSRGQFVSGNGGPLSINSSVIADVGTLAQWLNDDHVIAQTPVDDGVWKVRSYSLITGTWTPLDDRGANFLAAGGSRWIAQLAQPPVVFGNITEPTASLTLTGTDGRGAGSRDGTIATLAPGSGGLGLQLRTALGEVKTIGTGFVARDVHVIDANRVIWRDDAGTLHAHGVHVGTVAGPVGRPIYVETDHGPWLVYFTGAWGVVAHPVDHLELGRVVFTGNAFHHDAAVFGGGLWVGASSGAQERPGEEFGVNVWTLPITDLTGGTGDPVVPIGRDHYLGYFVGYPGASGGWDTNDDPPLPQPLPCNCALVTPDGRFLNWNGEWVGTFIHGGSSVEDVVNKAWAIAPTGKIPIAYWDGPWPSWPVNLPPNSWLCLWAYCKLSSTPTPEALEAWVRSVIADPNRPQLPLVLVAQCYTSNSDNTKDINALVPVYSRIARDTPSMIWTLGFSGTGRKGGLQDNPQTVPLWQQYFDGITGAPEQPEEPEEPEMPPDNGIVDGVCVNPQNYFLTLVHGTDPRQYREVIERIKEDLWKYGIGFQTRTPAPGDDLGEPTSRLYLPCAGCPNAAPESDHDKRFGVRQQSACWDEGCVVDTVQNDSAGTPIAWTWVERGPQPYQPIPAPDGEPDPDPTITIEIHGYDEIASRSDPEGCEIKFEVTGPPELTGMFNAHLESGEGERWFRFERLEDLHYLRGVRWKFGVPGTWPLIVEVLLDDGRLIRSDGSHRITVIP